MGVPVPSEMRGGPAFTAALEGRIRAARAVTDLAVAAAADQVKQDTQDKLMHREHPRGTPTPAAPGQPPAMISGRLKASVHTTRVTRMGDTYWASVGPTAPYSRIHELGGTTGRSHRTLLPPRPYLGPAFRGAVSKVRRIFRDHWSALGRGL